LRRVHPIMWRENVIASNCAPVAGAYR